MGGWRGEAGDGAKVEGNFMGGPQLSTRHAENWAGWSGQRHMFPNLVLGPAPPASSPRS